MAKAKKKALDFSFDELNEEIAPIEEKIVVEEVVVQQSQPVVIEKAAIVEPLVDLEAEAPKKNVSVNFLKINKFQPSDELPVSSFEDIHIPIIDVNKFKNDVFQVGFYLNPALAHWLDNYLNEYMLAYGEKQKRAAFDTLLRLFFENKPEFVPSDRVPFRAKEKGVKRYNLYFSEKYKKYIDAFIYKNNIGATRAIKYIVESCAEKIELLQTSRGR